MQREIFDYKDKGKETLVKLYKATVAFVAVLIFGVVGYMYIEGWNFFDAIYMTSITLATIGFQEVHPLSLKGRIFTMFLILFGIGTLAYAASLWVTFIIEGHLGGWIKKRNMNKKIQELKNHYIICAAGEIGIYVIEEFYKTNTNFVVITNDKNKVLPWVQEKQGILYIEGINEIDESLQLAGIDKANGLVCVLEDDRDNLYVTLSARQLNNKLRIVTHVLDTENVSKIKKAGADEVVSAIEIGGMRVASTMLRPSVVKFLDIMLYSGDKVLRVEEIEVPEHSDFSNKQISKCEIPQKTGLLVVAVKDKTTGEYIFNPSGEYIINPGDVLIVIGSDKQINNIKKCIGT